MFAVVVFSRLIYNNSEIFRIRVVFSAPPDEGPRISGGQDRYKPGDTVNVNCTSGRSKPAVQLAWYINGEQVGPRSFFHFFVSRVYTYVTRTVSAAVACR